MSCPPRTCLSPLTFRRPSGVRNHRASPARADGDLAARPSRFSVKPLEIAHGYQRGQAPDKTGDRHLTKSRSRLMAKLLSHIRMCLSPIEDRGQAPQTTRGQTSPHGERHLAATGAGTWRPWQPLSSFERCCVPNLRLVSCAHYGQLWPKRRLSPTAVPNGDSRGCCSERGTGELRGG